MNKIHRVKDIKLLIDKVMLPGYSYQTNFNDSDFLVDINRGLIICAKARCLEDCVVYEFVLDVQFLSNKELSYDEIVMVKNIIDILEDNRTFVLSRFKKYTVDEYQEELRMKEEKSERMLENLKMLIMDRLNID